MIGGDFLFGQNAPPNRNLIDTLRTLLDQLSIPSVRQQMFAIADTLIGGTRIKLIPL